MKSSSFEDRKVTVHSPLGEELAGVAERLHREERIHEKKINKIFSVDLLNGYYFSFLAIGTLYILLKFDISPDLKQGLFFILLTLLFGMIDSFKKASNREHNGNEVNTKGETIIHGNYFDQVENVVYNTKNTENNQVTDVKFNTPSNYFEVLKTIQEVPDSPDPDRPNIKDVLVELQSYVESETDLSVSDKEVILDQIQDIAIEAKSNPLDRDLVTVVESMQNINRNVEFKSRIVNALRQGAKTAVAEGVNRTLTPIAVKILISAMEGWMNSNDRNDKSAAD